MLDPNKIIQAMHEHGYQVAVGDDLMELIYIEGMNFDGSLNGNRPNYWDDLRTLIRVHQDGRVELLGSWEATTEPGAFFTDHPMNEDGAFHIDIGQQEAWSLGDYHGAALRQCRPIHGTRDPKHHYGRDGQHAVTGNFTVHHHRGYDYPKNQIGRSSAGCQVGRTVSGHVNEFMPMIMKDGRMKQNQNFVWRSTVMPADWIVKAGQPIIVTMDKPAVTSPVARPLISDLRAMFGRTA